MGRILITGASGFLGTHVTEVFRQHGVHDVLPVCSADYDLRIPDRVERMFFELQPDYVVHLAAKSGGILSNKRYPATYFHENMLLLAHMYDVASRHGVKRLLVPMGGCSYPAEAQSPIDETQMWDGYPQVESAGYSMAKKMALVLSSACQRQYGLDSVVVVPGNMYGEYDNYNLEESHVIPAMVRKFYEAERRGDRSITFWGTGAPQRDFVYAHDVAELFPYFLLDYTGDSPVNISSGKSISIRELVEHTARAVGYRGEINWDTSYPDGQMVKIFSVEKLQSLGKSCPTSLEEGLRKTIQWFQASYPDGIRL